MKHAILSAFADEYADSFAEQLSALGQFDIRYIEMRHVNGKNISLLSQNEAKEAKAMLESCGIKVSAIGSPIGKIAFGNGTARIFLDQYTGCQICAYVQLLRVKRKANRQPKGRGAGRA